MTRHTQQEWEAAIDRELDRVEGQVRDRDRLTTFGELFDALDERVEADGCGPELRHVRTICGENNLDADLIVPFLEQHGGHCDCEVLMNAEERIDADKRLPLLA